MSARGRPGGRPAPRLPPSGEPRGAPVLARRAFLRLAAAGLALPWARPATGDAEVGTGSRALAFHNLHTGETVEVLYRVDGRLDPDGLREIDWVLRDFRTGEARPIARGLLDLLWRLRTVLETDAPYEVISGYRSPRTNAMLARTSRGVSRASLHMRGMAIDVRLPDRPLPALRAAALTLGRGGVGYYPASGFVHVDVGRVRWW
jgi:uncharacterized protein YcbK (DUF882 family)